MIHHLQPCDLSAYLAYRPEAHPRFLVTGTPRSATKYMAQALNLAGFKVGHERLRRDGCVGWVGVGAILGAPKGWGPKDFDVVFHQTRDPLQTIASMTTLHRSSRGYAYQWIARPPRHKIPDMIQPASKLSVEMTKLYQAAWFWVQWNLRVAWFAHYRYRIEDVDAVFPELCEMLGRPRRLVPKLPRDVNRRTHGVVTQDKLERACPATLVREIATLAERYGYA